MLYGAEVAVCSELNTVQINTVWAECIILKLKICWCTKLVGFKRLPPFISRVDRCFLDAKICNWIILHLMLSRIFHKNFHSNSFHSS